jgi:hypothetical protein
MLKKIEALSGSVLISLVVIAFLAATLAAAGLLVYLFGNMSYGAVLTAWAITALSVTVLARMVSRLL